jgi:hypothetical protein
MGRSGCVNRRYGNVADMGMDVYGTKPANGTGEYFRRNVWGWRPLWECVEHLHPDLAAKVQYGYTNDGDGLGAGDATELGRRLRHDLSTGRVTAYLDQRDAALAALPTQRCEWCQGEGVRRDKVGVRMGMDIKGWCNGCEGTGECEPAERLYHLNREDIEEFAAFATHSGGFIIN